MEVKPADSNLLRIFSDALCAHPGNLGTLLDVYYFAALSSTMDVAQRIVEGETGEEFAQARITPPGAGQSGSVVLVRSEMQLRGRGRNGKTWLSVDHDNLYLTFAISAARLGLPIPAFSLTSALLLLQVLAGFGVNACLKWPNDLLVRNAPAGGYRKIAGVLVEAASEGTHIRTLLVGFGINVNQRHFPNGLPASSIAIVLGRCVDSHSLAAEVAFSFLKAVDLYGARGFSAFREDWLQSSMMNDPQVSFQYRDPLRGVIRVEVLDVTDAGALIARNKDAPNEEITILSGEMLFDGCGQ